MTNTDSDAETLSRRRVLRTGATTAGLLAVGGVAATGSVLAGRRGGRALVDGDFYLDDPFTVCHEGEIEMGASCMSGASAEQTYHVLSIEYCEDPGTCTIYVHPDEADVDSDGLYSFRSGKDCTSATNDEGDPLVKASFGPSNRECGGS